MCCPWDFAIWIFQKVHEEAFWILDAGFQRWFPSSTFLIFFPSSAPAVPLTDLTVIDFFILLLFFQLFLPPPPFLLLCFSLSHFSLCAYFILTAFFLRLSTLCDGCDSNWFFILSFQLSLSLPLFVAHFFFCISSMCHVLPVVNVLISSSCRVGEECRFNCRMANNCTTLIAILHSVFRNNQIRETMCVCVCVYVWTRVPVGDVCVRSEIVQMSAENCRFAAAISFLLSVLKDCKAAADFA